MEVNRPQQRQQLSRKGKRAWRKNIDIDDVELGLEKQREDQILGTDKVDDLFVVDTTGDDKIKNKYGKDIKTLKSTEILLQRSKVPGLNVERNNKKLQGVSKKEVHRLMRIAGKVQGETRTKAIHDKSGLINTKARDIWGDDDSSTSKSKPEIYEKSSAISYTPATRAPKTLKSAPIKLKENEKVPHAGKSYNPTLESWEGLIKQEFTSEKEKEDKKLELEKEKQRVMYLIENFDDKGELSSDNSDDDEEEEEEEEPSKIEVEGSLSINAPVQVKTKTRAQRNKEKRIKQRESLELELKTIKAQIKELEKLPEILSSVVAKEEEDKLPKLKKQKTKLFKYDNIEPQLEVKLSHELTDSLRSMKPEGNLLYDEMMKLQNTGKVESRKIVYKKRKYLPKITEKWTYKDFK